jgi:hypothetical protein
MKKTYNSLKEIELELKKNKLEKQILFEEMKLNAYRINENFSSNLVVGTVLPLLKKFALPYLIHRILK